MGIGAKASRRFPGVGLTAVNSAGAAPGLSTKAEFGSVASILQREGDGAAATLNSARGPCCQLVSDGQPTGAATIDAVDKGSSPLLRGTTPRLVAPVGAASATVNV